MGVNSNHKEGNGGVGRGQDHTKQWLMNLDRVDFIPGARESRAQERAKGGLVLLYDFG